MCELLRELEREHSGMVGWILDERGLVRRHINVFVNGDCVRENAPVCAEDRVDVLPAMRHGLDRRGEGANLELYFGTTTGEVFGSSDAGATWFAAASHLPPVYSAQAR